MLTLCPQSIIFQVTADLAPGFVRDTKADKVEFKFKRPAIFEICGSYSIQCVVKPDVNVDIFLRLPKVHWTLICREVYSFIYIELRKCNFS